MDSELLNVKFVYLPAVNYSMQQNKVSLIRLLIIDNLSENNYSNLKITINVDPKFGDFTTYVISYLPALESVRIDLEKPVLNTSFFSQITEKVTGYFKLSVHSDELLFEKQYEIDILAFDQWSGITVLPELLSSFVMPNHPAIAPIIKRATAFLGQWTGNPSLDEYQSRNANRVKMQVAAIYSAISEQNITYASTPASFEETGQRIRLIDKVLSDKIGNCLEMTLLLASCLEAIGVHPIIVVVKGHAFAGAWISPETYADNIIDDAAFLNKRIAEGINDIILLESTNMNQGNNVDFDKAVDAANSKLKEPDNFVLAIDIKRTRFSGIRPLPQRIMSELGWVLNEDKQEEIDFVKPNAVNPYDLSGIDTTPTSLTSKQSLWERKLLDLSLRNSLLNTRVTKSTLQLISIDLHKFEDALADGEEFQVLAKPKDWDNPLYDAGIYQAIGESDPILELVRSELTQKRLRSYLNEIDLSRALQHLYKSSRLSIEENGANTLYIALGFLKWYETPVSEKARFAPILLIPVEIIRKSAAKGYVIRTREEETMMNITLLEMLRMNFGITIPGLDPLPIDNSGLDVSKIFAIIRKGIMNQKKWDVEEQSILGIFSFNKFIMWNDIHNNVDFLKKNKIVSSLINGQLEWNADDDMADATKLDKILSPIDIVLPIHADSSQLEAIYEGLNNKTFILHGPPGTGKSQTITNIIANALYKGKRVLFVAEKMAALSVVQNRLTSIGLDPFCLELHSNKTKKSTVLGQLKVSTEVVKSSSPQSFREEANRLHELRLQLNDYIEALHKKYSFGCSLYEAINKYLAIETNVELTISQELVEKSSPVQYNKWNDIVSEIVSLGNAYGHPHNHPLEAFEISSYSSQLKENAAKIITETLDTARLVSNYSKLSLSILGLDFKLLSKDDLSYVIAVFEDLLKIPELTSYLINLPSFTDMMIDFKQVVNEGKERDNYVRQLKELFIDDILKLDAEILLNEWRQVSLKWFLPKMIGQNRISKKLRLYSKNGSLDKSKIFDILSQIIEYQKKQASIANYSDQFLQSFGSVAKIGNENWESIDQIIDLSLSIHKNILLLAKTPENVGSLKSSFSSKFGEGINGFKTIYQNDLLNLIDAYKKFQLSEDTLILQLGLRECALLDRNISGCLDKHINQLNVWRDNIELLKEWYLWLEVYRKCTEAGIADVFKNYQQQNISTDILAEVFEKSINKTFISYILAQNPNLELFKGSLFDDVIAKYRKISSDFVELTTKEVYSKLAANIPDFTKEASQNSEVGILQKNIRNNGRGMSIRKILDSIPTLLSRMCPCMLMSPISVAQYIDSKSEPFDLVIFDEASQMPTYEAVGAIARGKNIIVVGDPKQMPPTSFFSTNATDEDNIEIEDLESILDDCLALSMPSKYLLWHYRSKHESLISFSNTEYYDNKLLTFPSPDNIESKVKFEKIKGFYDKGKTRQNKAEAQAIVDEVAHRLRDEMLRKRSIGVVTFSSVQQGLIEDLLSDLFVSNPDLEKFALESEEPLFVKNLENVQGDERDIILFSIGYGPDEDGKVSMNFGPLNRIGGERRLNVAVSRARYEMKIYSTLTPDMIDLNRTSSVGVAGLKRFLEFAERGEKSTLDRQLNSQTKYSIEHLISKELKKKGYQVHTNIGCSGYKVDIGIVDPNQSNRYLLGVLCDGEVYRQTKTARDREIVQSSVLGLLGWNVLKVWTMDWWENPESVITRILNTIEKIKTDGYYISELELKDSELCEKLEPETINSLGYVDEVLLSTKEDDLVTQYLFAHLEVSGVHPDFFLFDNYTPMIKVQLAKVIEQEAPITRSLLFKRVLVSWGIGRLGQRIEGHLISVMKEISHYQSGNTIWVDEKQCQEYDKYRIDSNRDALDIPAVEAANAARRIVLEQISLPTNDLIRQTACLLGFSRTGTNVEQSMSNGIQEAVNREYFKVEDGKCMIMIG